jgi:hypothetical protein
MGFATVVREVVKEVRDREKISVEKVWLAQNQFQQHKVSLRRNFTTTSILENCTEGCP